MEGVNRGGAKGASDVSNRGVLVCAKVSEACLACVPDRSSIGENKEDYRIEDSAPLRPLKTLDRVAKEL